MSGNALTNTLPAVITMRVRNRKTRLQDDRLAGKANVVGLRIIEPDENVVQVDAANFSVPEPGLIEIEYELTKVGLHKAVASLNYNGQQARTTSLQFTVDQDEYGN